MQQSANNADVELRMMVSTVRRGVVVGPVVVLIAWAVAGGPGALAAALGVAAVVLNFLLSGWMLATAARISLGAYHAAALFGFVVRFGILIAIVLVALQFVDLNRPVFAIATVGTYFALLILQVSSVSRGKERELEWTS